MVPVNELCDLPTEWWGHASPEEATDVAVHLLMSHLGQIRGVQYGLLYRPDQINRRGKAPDYRCKCRETGEIVAVEYKRFVKPEDREAGSHLEKGKRFGPKGGVKPMERQGEQYGAIWADDAQAILGVLRNFIVDIIGRGQLQAAEASERLLLIQDEQYVSQRSVMTCEFSFTQRERDSIDHVFLLSPGSSGREPKPSKIFQIW